MLRNKYRSRYILTSVAIISIFWVAYGYYTALQVRRYLWLNPYIQWCLKYQTKPDKADNSFRPTVTLIFRCKPNINSKDHKGTSGLVFYLRCIWLNQCLCVYACRQLCCVHLSENPLNNPARKGHSLWSIVFLYIKQDVLGI